MRLAELCNDLKKQNLETIFQDKTEKLDMEVGID